MSLASSCKDYKITNGVLHASCRKSDDTYQASHLKLDDHIGFSDNKLLWGHKGFTNNAESTSVSKEGILLVKYKVAGKLVEYKLDLNQHIKNTNGVLEPIDRAPSVQSSNSPKKHDTLGAVDLTRGTSIASTASTGSAFSSFSAASATSTTSTSMTSVSSSTSTSKSHFSSSHFKSQSKSFLIEETCSKVELKGHILHAECRRIDGSHAHSHIDLDSIVGLVEGQLQWDHTGFSKHCFEYALDGFFLVVKYKTHEGSEYRIARLDLRTRLRNHDGVLVLIELNKKLSVMLSEVPWMKFKVIAEPDLSVFTKHPVMQETLVRIAETTVEHVTVEMHKMLTIAMESAITAITASAMKHVSSQMEILLQDSVGHASASASVTGAEHLHIYGGVCGCGRAYGHTGHCGHRHAYGYGDAYRHATVGIHAHSQHERINGNEYAIGHQVTHSVGAGSL